MTAANPRWVRRLGKARNSRIRRLCPDAGVTSGAGPDDPRRSLSPPHGTIKVVRVVEAQYEDGVLRPAQRLGLRPGEQVGLIVVRRPDPSRWDLARLVKAGNREDLALAEQGLTEWSGELDATERA